MVKRLPFDVCGDPWELYQENRKDGRLNLDTTMPIEGSDIPNFLRWVNWHDYGVFHKTPKPWIHLGFDFAAYFKDQGECVLGLPEGTPVRAIADGKVRVVEHRRHETPYSTYIDVIHDSDLFFVSHYGHVCPTVKDQSEVKKGDVIATLYKEDGDDLGNLVHLHFAAGFVEGNLSMDGTIDPKVLLPKYLGRGGLVVAEPQGSINFSIHELRKQPRIVVANFKRVEANGEYSA